MSKIVKKEQKKIESYSESESESEQEQVQEIIFENKNDEIDMCDFVYDPDDKYYYEETIWLTYLNTNIKFGDMIQDPNNYKNFFDNVFIFRDYKNQKEHYNNFLIRFFDLAFGLDNFNEQKLNLIMKHIRYPILYYYDKSSYERYNCIIKVAYQRNKKLPELCINNAFEKYNWDLMNFLLKNDLVKITKNKLEHLFLCLRTKPRYKNEPNFKYECNIDIKVIDLILKNKIALTEKCFDNLIEANKIANTDIEINWKTMFENKYCCDVSVIINLMYNYGFAITQEHFAKLIKNRLHIDNYKKYKLEIIKEIEDACNEVLYYPYKEIKVTDIGYKKMMKHSVKLNELNKIQQKFNLKNEYNITDLELACSRENVDIKSVEYLMKEYKIQPNFKCVSNLLKRDKVSKRAITCANSILDRLKEKYEK